MSKTARIGLLVPPANVTMEDDFARWLPWDVGLHVNRLAGGPDDDLLSMLVAMEESAGPAARMLAMAPIDVVAYGCTSGSFYGGPHHDRAIADCIAEAAGGIPTVVTASAVGAALHSLEATTIAVVSPYEPAITARLEAFYTGAGFRIASIEHLDVPPAQIHRLDPAAVLTAAAAAMAPGVEAILISCTALRAGEVIEEVETVTAVPVVTSNQATLWACLTAIGMGRHSVRGGGLLLGSGPLAASATGTGTAEPAQLDALTA